MTRTLFDQPLDLLERHFQALQERAANLPEVCRTELETALQGLSQAIAALRAGREAGAGPPAAAPNPCEAILQHVFSAIPDLITVIDQDFNIIMSNWYNQEHISEEERRGRPKCYRVYVNRDRPCESCQGLEVFATGEPRKLEWLSPINGKTVEIHAFPIFDESGWVPLVAEHVRDITERHLAEQALRESEGRFRTLIEDSPESLFLTDTQGTVLAASRVAAQRLGKSLTEVVGRSTFEHLPPEVASRCRAFFEQAIAAARPVRLEDARGGRHFDIHFNPILDTQGQVSMVSILAIDITDRKNTEQALKESEERFRMLFDHAPDAYILADMQGEIIDCNQATEELAGYGREELVGNNFACLPWLDFRQQVRLADLLAQTARGEVMGPVDFTVTRKDGAEVIAEGMNLPLYIQGQNLVLTIVRDITARKQAEAALKESEARFRHISSTISDISYSCSAGPDGGYTLDWLAGAAERITGYSVEEIKAQCCWGFLVIEADQPLFEKHITGLAAGESGACELRLRHKNGGTVWVASFAKIVQPPEQPELLSLYGGLVDITARKQAEAALAAHLQFLQLLLDTIPNPIFFKDTQGAYLGCNKAFEDFIGITRQEIVGKNVYDLSPRELADEYQRMDLAAFQTTGTQVYESQVQAADGARRHVVFHKATFPGPTGGLGGLVGIITDITDLKQAEAALKESEARYRALFDASPDAIIVMDMEMNVIMGNRRGAEMMGYDSLDQAMARRGIDDIAPEDRPRLMAAMQTLMTTGRTQTFETTMLKQDGSRFPSLNSAALIRDAAGNPQAIIGIARDITALKQAEAGLRKSEELFRSLVDHITLGITLISSDYRIIMTNLAQGNLFHKHPRELINRECFREFEKRPAVCPHCPGAIAMATGQKAEVETTGVRDDGSSLVARILAFPSFGPDGEINGFIEVVEDITQSKQVEVAFQESERRFRLMAETIQDVFWIATPRIGRTLYVSPGFEYIWGRTSEALYHNPKLYLETVHPEDRERVKIEIIAARKQTIPWSHEYRIVRPDGTTRWIQNRGFPVRDNQGIVTLFTGVATDITEHKALEEQLLQAQKMEAVGRLAGGVAHDFNNLLMAITGYGELMRAKILKDDPLYGYLENILNAGDRAAALTQQLLTFSRRQIVHPKVVDLNRIVLDLEPMLRRLIGEDLHLEVVTDRRPAAVKADPNQMGQIIMNLVVNARDAMPQGGRLTLKTTPVDFKRSHHTRFGQVPPGAYVMLEVADTGVGMDEATQAHVFEPFFTTKEPGKGTGLGLSTVYGIVKQSGGYLDLASASGAGSTFTIYLPRLEGIVEPPEAKVPITASFRGEETVLLVEDEDVLRGLLAKFLRIYGYTVLEARHGGEALLACERHPGPIHLLVTDVVMPRMSGRELAERLTPLRPDMKVIFMSGYTEDALVQHGVTDHSVSFLQKPFKPIELARRVYALLHPPVSQ